MIHNSSPEWLKESAQMNDEGNREFSQTIEGPAQGAHEYVSNLEPKPDARRIMVILTDEHAKFLRALVACEIVERHRELQVLVDPDRFHNMRDEDNNAIRIGNELIELLKAAPPWEQS